MVILRKGSTLDKWKSKNTYEIMKWLDDPNFDYSDRRCSGDNSIAIKLLPVLLLRGNYHVLAPATDELENMDGDWRFKVWLKSGGVVNKYAATISEAITAGVMEIIAE